MRTLTQKEKDFIQEHLNDDVNKLALKKNIFSDDIRKNVVIHQISSKKKCTGKLDFLLEFDDFIFPKTLSIEQSSSEITAFFKANKFKAKHSIDLTGGMGIDSIFFAQTSLKHTYNEKDKDLYSIFNHNKEVLGLSNCDTSNSDALELLDEAILKYDLINFDPARRSKAGEKKYFLEDTLPNPMEIINKLNELDYKGKLLFKASPMVDIYRVEKQLQSINETFVISVNNECKELLFYIDFADGSGYKTSYKNAINLSHKRSDFIRMYNNDASTGSKCNKIGKYIYEPNSSLMKIGFWNTIQNEFEIIQIAENTHLFTAENFINDFHGRAFELIAELKPDEKLIKSFLPQNKANIISRNFPMSVDEIRKKYKIEVGGDFYIIFVSTNNNSKKALVCKKIG